MADISAIRQAIADAVSNVGEIQSSPWMLSDPTPPSAHVFPDETDYHQAMQNGAERWGLAVQVFVSFSTDRGAQELLDQMLASAGPRSIKAAIEADATLGGLVADVMVERTTGYQTYQLNATTQALGATWHLAVLV